MFPTFTGQSRRARNVNLSGKPKKDQNSGTLKTRFGQPSTAPGAQNSILQAQQERERRTAERKRLNAAVTIQRTWKRSRDKGHRRDAWRQEWDDLFKSYQSAQKASSGGPTASNVDSKVVYLLLWILARHGAFVASDLGRLSKLVWALSRLKPDDYKRRIDKDPELYILSRRLFTAVLSVLDRPKDQLAAGRIDIVLDLLEFSTFFTALDPYSVGATFSNTLGTSTSTSSFYKSISNLLGTLYLEGRLNSAIVQSALQTAISPLNTNSTSSSPFVYKFVAEFLTVPNLPFILATGDGISEIKRLLSVSRFVQLASLNGSGSGLVLEGVDTERRLSLLSSIIAIAHEDFTSGVLDQNASMGYVRLLSVVMSSVAGEISRRISIEDADMGEDSDDGIQVQPLPEGVRTNVLRLKEKSFILRVFEKGFSSGVSDRLTQASFLASFALALLFIFPNDRQDLRMWMCLADTSTSEPLVKYLWEATKHTAVYTKVKTLKDSAVDSFIIETFKPTQSQTVRLETLEIRRETLEREEQWRIVLLFLELYGFLLVLMDDEEFFAGGDLSEDPSVGNKKTRASALPLKDVEQLTLFLKSFAFAMYWRSQDLEGAPLNSPGEEAKAEADSVVVGVTGMSIAYVKGVVTTLTRQLYSRDSRRRFLPDGHWLMTHRFDMEGFIPAVVLEEEQRHDFEEQDDDDDDETTDVLASPYNRLNARLQKYKDFQLAQRKRNYLAPIAPRLEILQTLPFFIPFNTRVQIFREFIMVDQRRRMGENIGTDEFGTQGMPSRNSGFVHPNLRPTRPTFDGPRQGGLGSGSSRSMKARIRRDQIFDDAFKAFFPVGEAIKEPMSITFIDEHGEEEAGIDGGGVTKEFLISVTKEAFLDPKVDQDSLLPPIKLFEENSSHALYPNPLSLLQLKDFLEDIGLVSEKGEYMKTMLQKYEFLGRIVGKCMYEGILIDVAFASSFLLKWSHRETGANDGYKPSVNDIRDLDEDLYQGLISLKNYTGDVESDLSLNFAVTLALTPTKHLTINLIPNGASIPVTSSNRLQYLHAMAHFRLASLPERQTTAFLRGLGQIIRPTWLSMFNQSELQTLVGGDTSPLDIDDLRANTVYSGLYALGDDRVEHPTIQLFWAVMKEDLTEAQRRAVVKFVTSVSRAPLLGFRVLNPRFAIRDSIGGEELLPSSSTCVNLLKLPVYTSRRRLREKLVLAVESGTGFHLS